MTELSEIQGNINELVRQYFASQKEEPFVPGKTKIPLITPSYGSDSILQSR